MTDVKGWCLLTLKVFLYTCGAAIGGLCVAFGIGLLLAGPANAATQPSPGSVLGSTVQTVQATATTTTQAATSVLPAATSAPTAAPGQLVSTATAAAGSTVSQLVSTATAAAGSTVSQLASTVTTLTSAPRPGSGGPAPALPSGTGATGGSGGSGTTGGTGAVQPQTPRVVIPPRTPRGIGTQNPGSGQLGSGSPAVAYQAEPIPAAAGRNALPAASAASRQGAGGPPALPAGPPLPVGTPDGPGIVPGSGSGSGSGTAGVALLICACLLVLGSARRGNTADAPSTSAILCPDEVPG